MPNHPFLVWLAYNVHRDNSTKNVFKELVKVHRTPDCSAIAWDEATFFEELRANLPLEKVRQISDDLRRAWGHFTDWQMSTCVEWSEKHGCELARALLTTPSISSTI